MRDGFLFQRFALSDLWFMLREMLLPGRALQTVTSRTPNWPAAQGLHTPEPPWEGGRRKHGGQRAFCSPRGARGWRQGAEASSCPIAIRHTCRCWALLHICLAPIFSQLIPARKPRGSALPHLGVYSFTWRMQNPFWKKKKKNKSHLVQAAMRQLLQLLLTFTLGK